MQAPSLCPPVPFSAPLPVQSRGVPRRARDQGFHGVARTGGHGVDLWSPGAAEAVSDTEPADTDPGGRFVAGAVAVDTRMKGEMRLRLHCNRGPRVLELLWEQEMRTIQKMGSLLAPRVAGW